MPKTSEQVIVRTAANKLGGDQHVSCVGCRHFKVVYPSWRQEKPLRAFCGCGQLPFSLIGRSVKVIKLTGTATNVELDLDMVKYTGCHYRNNQQ